MDNTCSFSYTVDDQTVVQVAACYETKNKGLWWWKESLTIRNSALAQFPDKDAAIDEIKKELKSRIRYQEHMAEVGRCSVGDPDIEKHFRAGMERDKRDAIALGRYPKYWREVAT